MGTLQKGPLATWAITLSWAVGQPTPTTKAPTTTSSPTACVVGRNVGPLIKTAKALVPCVDKADSGIAGQSCGLAIKHIAHGCADAVFGSTLVKNCPKSCVKCSAPRQT